MSIAVQIELGHKAWKNIKPTTEGYTHDWTVFVQGVNGNEIKHIVEKVIFQLPDSYQDSKRIMEKPPFALSESTSQSISIKIVVFFCTESKLSKVNYIYDMHISDDEAVNVSWMRKLTFPNPSKEFKEKLLLAGGELVDLQKTLPVMTGGLLKCKVEPDNKIKIENDLDDGNATLNTTIQKFDNSQNKRSMSNEELLRCLELMKENGNLRRENAEIKEKIGLQKQVIAFCEESVSNYEKQIHDTNMSINHFKRKNELAEREVSTLKLELAIYENELNQINNQISEYSEGKIRGTIRGETEDMNASVVVGKEKETVTEPSTFISSPTRDGSSTSQNSSLLKNTFVSTKNQHIFETVKLRNTTSVGRNSSQSKPAVSINDLCNTLSGNCFLSQSKNETESTHLQNLYKNHHLKTLDNHRSVSSANTVSLKSTNINDVEKSLEDNSVKAYASLNKLDMRKKDVEKSVYGSSIKANSSLSKPEIIIIDAEKSLKGSSVKANASFNKFNVRNNSVEKIMEENSFSVSNSVSTKPFCRNKPREQFGTLGQEHNVSSIKKDIKSSNSNCKEDCPKLPKKRERKRQKKGGIIVEGNTLEASTSMSTEPSRNKTQEQFETPVQKHNVDSIKLTKIESSNFNCKEKRKENSKNGHLQNFRNAYQTEKLHANSICKELHQDISDTSAPKLVSFITEHCQKLMTELNRIKNSEFSKYREGTNSLFYKLRNIDINPITEECCKQYLQSLIDYFTNPKTFDMATLIYLVVDYLYRDRVQLESLPTYILNEDTYVFLPPSENCIISALYAVDNKSLPHLNRLVKNTLDIIHQVIISKKNMAVNGLASLCRVFMEMCRRSNDRWEPLFLSCELLRLGHPLAPYLINSLAAVWRDPFKLYDKFSVEGNMVLGAIMYGMKEKPLLMDNNLWRLTQRLRSTYFPRPFIINHNQATEFLTAKIVSRCVEGLFENLWMLASPLVIFVSKETWDFKMQFRNGYILPNLLHFSRCLSEHAFGLFCNLHVDIFSFPHENLYEDILQYFDNTSLHQGFKFVQDCAAIALLKYIGVTNKHIPAPLRDWFLRNQDNPKLALIVDLYCKKVMESHDSFLLWDDVIIV